MLEGHVHDVGIAGSITKIVPIFSNYYFVFSVILFNSLDPFVIGSSLHGTWGPLTGIPKDNCRF